VAGVSPASDWIDSWLSRDISTPLDMTQENAVFHSMIAEASGSTQQQGTRELPREFPFTSFYLTL